MLSSDDGLCWQCHSRRRCHDNSSSICHVMLSDANGDVKANLLAYRPYTVGLQGKHCEHNVEICNVQERSVDWFGDVQ